MAKRIVGLDVARGVAILGTLATNIWIVSHPGGMLGYLDSPTTPGAAPWQQAAEHVLQQLANGKFLGLLTLMFGIGLAIQADSAQRRERSWPGPYLWRAALLLLDGLLNYLLVVEYDVLMGYAVTGAIVAYIIARSPRVQWACVAVCVTVHLALVGLVTSAMVAFGGVGVGQPVVNPYRDGSWWDLVLLRVDNWAVFRFEPVFMLFLAIAMFTLGNRLYRAGVLEPRGERLRSRLLIAGAIAFPADMVLGLASPNWLFVTRYVLAPVVAVGLLALIVNLVDAGRFGVATRPLADLGRVALSAYVLQNLLGTALFYGWGADLGAMPPAWRLPVTVLAWFAISGVILLAARLWLQRFSRGPLEWLWARSYALLAERGGDSGAHPRVLARA